MNSMKEFFFGVNPLAILGLAFAIAMLILGIVSPEVPGLLRWIATVVVVTCVAGMKSLVDSDARRFLNPSAKVQTIEGVLSNEICASRDKKWPVIRRVIGATLIAFAFLGASLLFAEASLALELATQISAISLGYELLMRAR